MKSKTLILSCLIVLSVLLSLGFTQDWQNTGSRETNLKIGMVSVQEVFERCDRASNYLQNLRAEGQKIRASIEELKTKIEAANELLETLEPGSQDYLEHYRDVLQKQAEIETRQTFFKNGIALQKKRVLEMIYKDILAETKAVAEEKSLDLVFKMGKPRFPISDPIELQVAIDTNTLLYCSKGIEDITEEVIKRIDLKDTEKTSEQRDKK